MRKVFHRGACALLAASSSSSSPSSAGAAGFHTCTTPRLARLAVVRPDVAAEWIPELNEDADIAKVEVDWDMLAWWRCQTCGYQWQSPVSQRAQKEQGCPQCAPPPVNPLGAQAPLQSENADAVHTSTSQTETTTKERSSTRTDMGHEDRNSGSSPGGITLQHTHPAVAARWHPTLNNNLRPTDVTAESTAVVWWLPDASQTVDDEGSSGASAAAPFLRAVDRFAFDSRSDAQIQRDRRQLEEQILQELEEVANVPTVLVEHRKQSAAEAEELRRNGGARLSSSQSNAVLIEAILQQSSSSVQGNPQRIPKSSDQQARNVLRLFTEPVPHQVSSPRVSPERSGDAAAAAASSSRVEPVFQQKQPITQTDAALRQKTLQFYIQSILDFKSSGSSGHFSVKASTADAAGQLHNELPSYAFDDREAWRRYFTVAKVDAEDCWREKLQQHHASLNDFYALQSSSSSGSSSSSSRVGAAGSDVNRSANVGVDDGAELGGPISSASSANNTDAGTAPSAASSQQQQQPRKVGQRRHASSTEESLPPPPPRAPPVVGSPYSQEQPPQQQQQRASSYPRKPRMTPQHDHDQQPMRTERTMSMRHTSTADRYMGQREVDLLAEARQSALQQDVSTAAEDALEALMHQSAAAGSATTTTSASKGAVGAGGPTARGGGPRRTAFRPRIALEMPEESSGRSSTNNDHSSSAVSSSSNTLGAAPAIGVPVVPSSGPRKVARPRRVLADQEE